jgi:hypothetical protein
MDTKQLILHELDQTPEPLQAQVLDFVRFLKHQQQDALELQEDLEAAHVALADAQEHGTIPWATIKAELGVVVQ